MSNEEIPVIKNYQPQQKVADVTPQVTNDFPSEVIDLPSEGYFYPTGSPLSSGRIELKCMTAKEEDIL